MVGERRTVSPSRTYVIVLEDLVAKDEARFEKFVLPNFVISNSSGAARDYYYNYFARDVGIRILSCVALEDYMATVENVLFEEPSIFDKPKEEPVKLKHIVYKTRHFDTNSSNSLEEDINQVRQMLDAWNDEQEHTSTSYTMILRAILREFAAQKRTMQKIKEFLLDRDA